MDQIDRTGAERLRALFRGMGQMRHARRGDYLYRAGATLSHLFMIEAGWLSRLRVNTAGKAAFTALHIHGEIVGLDGLASERLDDDVVALTSATVLRVPVGALRAATSQDGVAMMGIATLLAAECGFLREALLAVGHQSSHERIATFLLQTYDRLVFTGAVAPGVQSFELPLTQTQLAAATGMTPVHINRILRKLREGGIVDVQQGVVHLGDLDALREMACAQPDATRG